MAIRLYSKKNETEKSAKSPSTKNQKRLCKSTLYAVTNLELTSSRFLSLLSLNYYTSIAGAVTLRMLSKQRSPYTIHVKTTFFSKHPQNSVYGGLCLLQVYGNVNHTTREVVSLPVSIFLQRVGPSRSFSPQ